MTDRAVVALRRPGRPRSAEADEAIMTATLAIFAECGLDGLTVEGVAARACVGKSTIYRRYPCKLDLLIAASSYFAREREAPPDTGTAAGDLRMLVDRLIVRLTCTPVGAALPMMVAARRRVPQLAAARDELTAKTREPLRQTIRRAIERGELRNDTDADDVIDAYASAILYRLILDRPLDDAFAGSLVETVLRAFAP
jgi:AcrR family transcriptional regulator